MSQRERPSELFKRSLAQAARALAGCEDELEVSFGAEGPKVVAGKIVLPHPPRVISDPEAGCGDAGEGRVSKFLASPLVAVAVSVAACDAAACVPIRYDITDLSVESMAAELVRDAISIDIMRVVSRIQVPADPLYAEWSGPLYEYRLETVETLSGRSSGVLSFTAPDDGWIAARIPGSRKREHQSLQWLTPEGYDLLQETSIYLAHDFNSTTCAAAMTFEMDAHYLVFRGQDRRLLRPGLRGRAGWANGRVNQRPVLEQIHGANDPWLLAVRRALHNEMSATRH